MKAWCSATKHYGQAGVNFLTLFSEEALEIK